MSGPITPSQQIQNELVELKTRLDRMEEDLGSVVTIQSRILTSLNELQGSVLKLREAMFRIKERLG